MKVRRVVPQHTPELMNGRRKGCMFTIMSLIRDRTMSFVARGAKTRAAKSRSFSPNSYKGSAHADTSLLRLHNVSVAIFVSVHGLVECRLMQAFDGGHNPPVGCVHPERNN